MILEIPTLYPVKVYLAKSAKVHPVLMPTSLLFKPPVASLVENRRSAVLAREWIGPNFIEWLNTANGPIRPVLGKNGNYVDIDLITNADPYDLVGSVGSPAGQWWSDHPGALDEGVMPIELRGGTVAPEDNHIFSRRNARHWDTSAQEAYENLAFGNVVELTLHGDILYKPAPLPGTAVLLSHDGPHLARWVDPFFSCTVGAMYFGHAEYANALRCYRLLATRNPFPQSVGQIVRHEPDPVATLRSLRSALATLEELLFPKIRLNGALQQAYERARQIHFWNRNGAHDAMGELYAALLRERNPKLERLVKLLGARSLSFRGPSEVDDEDVPDAELEAAPPTLYDAISEEDMEALTSLHSR